MNEDILIEIFSYLNPEDQSNLYQIIGNLSNFHDLIQSITWTYFPIIGCKGDYFKRQNKKPMIEIKKMKLINHENLVDKFKIYKNVTDLILICYRFMKETIGPLPIENLEIYGRNCEYQISKQSKSVKIQSRVCPFCCDDQCVLEKLEIHSFDGTDKEIKYIHSFTKVRELKIRYIFRKQHFSLPNLEKLSLSSMNYTADLPKLKYLHTVLFLNGNNLLPDLCLPELEELSAKIYNTEIIKLPLDWCPKVKKITIFKCGKIILDIDSIDELNVYYYDTSDIEDFPAAKKIKIFYNNELIFHR